ncbi:MAG: uracil-DNA glycosylase [Bacteroidetes bacterium]|nr:uracil-DNA glycosylase [Bacteroidota bacterium]
MTAATTINPQIEESWKEALLDEFSKPYFSALKTFLTEEKNAGKIIYPKGSEIFNAFTLTPFEKVKVVILGQDPYHNPGQAHGLSFSVVDGVKPPPSLQNIYKEIYSDLGLPIPSSGNLTKWAAQGVFLLNAILTVQANQPASHQKKGWEEFTDAVIKNLSDKRTGLVFILWGNYAKQKIALIDTSKHHILTSAHPSPFSAANGFFGCRHFSKTNALLEKSGISPIDWKL